MATQTTPSTPWATTRHEDNFKEGSAHPKVTNCQVVNLGVYTQDQIDGITEEKLRAIFFKSQFVQFGNSDSTAYAYENLLDRLDSNLFDNSTAPVYEKIGMSVDTLTKEQAEQGYEVVVAMGFDIPA